MKIGAASSRKLRKKNKPAFKHKKDECDFYWSVLVKARAGFVSEISGNSGELHAHHLRGKTSYSLRYSLLNGICVTAGEHKFGFHHEERKPDYEEQVKILRGDKIFDSLSLLKNEDSEPIEAIRDYLIEELKKHKREIRKFFIDKNYKNANVVKRYKELLHNIGV